MQAKADREILQVSESLNRVGFDPLTHKYESTCAICLLDFQTSDTISQLECHFKHIYHVSCLTEWIKSSKNYSCPVCRVPI